MLGLRIALSVAKGVIDEIGGLLSKLARRSTYSENLADSRAVISDIDSYDLLDKATILLTPTATSDARVHSVKTYTGDELVTNGTFDTDSDWSLTRATISGGTANLSTTDGSLTSVVQSVTAVGNRYYFSIEVSDLVGELEFAAVGGLGVYSTITSNGTHTGYFTSAHASIEIKRKFGITNVSATIDNVSVVDVSSDFDFDRASSATRINSDGLVQDMQSITDPELVLNGDFEELGDEEVTNGTFDTDSDWSKGTGWSIADGVASFNGTNDSIRQDVGLQTGKTYKITFTTNVNQGGIAIVLGGSVQLSSVTASGTHTFYGVSGVNALLYFQPTSFEGQDFQGSIDNVSVQQVDPNDRWTLTQATITDGSLNLSTSDGSYTAATQTLGTIGNVYEISLDVSDIVGTISVAIGGGTDVDITTNGTHTVYITSASTTFEIKRKFGITNVSATIDNISVKDITFSEDVDLARINYDSNGENGHWLLEPTSTNLLPYSEDFTQGWSVADATITPNSITSPSGQDNASTLTTSASGGAVEETLTISDGDLTFSLFVRKGTTNGVRLRIDAATDVNGYFNINDGTIFSQTDDAKIEVINANWYKVSISASITSFVKASIYTTDGTTSYDNGTVYIWGAQLEQLSYATSYIPTHGSTVTRATETLTGSGNSTLINSTEGVLYAEIAMLSEDDKASNNQLFLNDGTSLQRVGFFTDGNGDIRVQLRDVGVINNVTALDQSETGVNVAAFNKIAIQYKSGENKLFVNGSRITDTNFDNMTFDLSTLSELDFGSGANSNYFRGKCKALAVFNESLSDTELENLTS